LVVATPKKLARKTRKKIEPLKLPGELKVKSQPWSEFYVEGIHPAIQKISFSSDFIALELSPRGDREHKKWLTAIHDFPQKKTFFMSNEERPKKGISYKSAPVEERKVSKETREFVEAVIRTLKREGLRGLERVREELESNKKWEKFKKSGWRETDRKAYRKVVENLKKHLGKR